MATASVPFFHTPVPTVAPGVRDRFPAVTERSRLKAQDHSDASQDAEEFMRHYDATLLLLHQGVDVVGAARGFVTAVHQAAEVEALAAHRIHQSCWHRQPCRCPECSQRRQERTAEKKD